MRIHRGDVEIYRIGTYRDSIGFLWGLNEDF